MKVVFLILILVFFVSCSSTELDSPTLVIPTPDVPLFSKGDALNLVLNEIPSYGCDTSITEGMLTRLEFYSEEYLGLGKWEIKLPNDEDWEAAKKSIQFQLAQIAGITPSQHIWVVDEITNTVTIKNVGTCKL
tara:strand:+ start:494 stop:892 length:399 start_codon:yes stop_codon:yes gene_type:complete